MGRGRREAAAPAPDSAQTSEPGLRRRAISSENLVRAATLIRSESQKALLQHAAMIASGEHPLDIKFSAMVAASSLLYLCVAAMYFVHGWQLFGLLFSLVTCCSLLADSVAPQNKLVCTADRVFATLSTILSPGRILLYPGLACVQVKLLVVVLLAGSLRVLHWSRESPDMGHFRWRHTLWHVCSAAALTWLARVDGLGLHQTPLFDVTAEASRVLVYASQAASV